MSQGGLSPRVNWKALAKYEFALPSLEEQRRIAEVLQAASKCVILLSKNIAPARALKRELVPGSSGDFFALNTCMDWDFLKSHADRSTILRDFMESRRKQDFASKILATYSGNTRKERAARRILFRLLKMAYSYKIPLD